MDFKGVGTIKIPEIIPGFKWDSLFLAGSFLSTLFNIALFISVFLAFYWLIWGAFQYITAQGKKEDLAKARARMTWAIIGLIVVFLAYTIARYASEIFPPSKGQLPF